MPIEWDPETMTVGLEDIDRQHLQWVLYFNQFDDAVTKGGDVELLGTTLHFLERYSRIVFHSEEVLMTMRGDPDRHKHQAAHMALLNDMARLQAALSARQIAAVGVATLKRDLSERITAHLQVVDRRLQEPVR